MDHPKKPALHLVWSAGLPGNYLDVISNLLGGGNSNICCFHPYLGKWSNLTNMFQMGWFNHQLVYILGKSLESSNLYNFIPLKKVWSFVFFLPKIKLTKSATKTFKRESHRTVLPQRTPEIPDFR